MNSKVSSFIKRVVAGIVIGIGGILPGVSGGIMAVSMGLYRPMLDAVAGFFKSPVKNFLFLLPLGIGGVAGLLGVSFLLDWLLNAYMKPILYLFIGLVAGGVPSFIHQANEHGFKKRYLWTTFVGVLVVAGLFILDKTATDGRVWELNPLTSAMSGGILAVGTVIPGISTSFILMYMGLYQPLLSALTSLNLSVLIWVGVGAVIVALALIKLVRFLFSRFHGYAYYGVLGFLLATMVLIFPRGVEWSWNQLLCVALAIGGYFAAFYMEKAMSKDGALKEM